MTTEETIKALKRAARRIHADMPRGGRLGSKKGKRGFKRHPKHPKKEIDR